MLGLLYMLTGHNPSCTTLFPYDKVQKQSSKEDKAESDPE